MNATKRSTVSAVVLGLTVFGSAFSALGQGQFLAVAPSASQGILESFAGSPITSANYGVDILYGATSGIYTEKVAGTLASLGRLNSGTVTTPFPGGTTIYVRVRAWTLNSGYGSTYEELYPSASHPGGFPNLVGVSDEFTVELRQSNLQNMSGMLGFWMAYNSATFYGVTPVPEPSSVLLAGVCVVGLAFLRRRS